MYIHILNTLHQIELRNYYAGYQNFVQRHRSLEKHTFKSKFIYFRRLFYILVFNNNNSDLRFHIMKKQAELVTTFSSVEEVNNFLSE